MARSRLSWQVTPIMASGPRMRRASAREPSDWPMWTPSQPARRARSGRSLSRMATPWARATGARTSTAARTSASSAGLSRICRAATSPAERADSSRPAKADRSSIAGGVIRYSRQGGRGGTTGSLAMPGKCGGWRPGSILRGRRRGEVDPADLAETVPLDPALDQFVAEQGEDTAAQEDGPGVAVPVGAGRHAAVLDRAVRPRREPAQLGQAALGPAQEQHVGGAAEQIVVAVRHRPVDRQ